MCSSDLVYSPIQLIIDNKMKHSYKIVAIMEKILTLTHSFATQSLIHSHINREVEKRTLMSVVTSLAVHHSTERT